MIPRIEISSEKKLIGIHMSMSLVHFNTSALWQNFMPRRKEIQQVTGSDLISMTIYKPGHFSDFHPDNTFDKWAAVEVADFNSIPVGMDAFLLPGGLYAVFDYKGLNTDPAIFRHIFEFWLPNSVYELDDRPHFEILGSKYKNNDPDSEEEIWIPIQTN